VVVTAHSIPDAPGSTTPFTAIFSGPEEEDLIGFVQEHDSGFKAFDTGRALLGDTFTNWPAAADAIWSDCLGATPRTNGGGNLHARTQPPQGEPSPKPNGGHVAAELRPAEVSTAVDPATPELTLFTNARGALTKQFTLDADGKLVKTEGGQMVAGTAMRIAIDGVRALAELLGTVSSDQALALGSIRSGLPAQVTVTTKKALGGGAIPNTISRSREYLTFGQGRRGFCLVDFDRKGITPEVQDKLEQSGDFVAALGTVIPELKATGYVVRASTSAGLFRTDTGQRFDDSGGMHLYLGIEDVSDSERFLKTLHDRCWLAGLGWYWISAAGTLLARSIIDRAVATPEHLCFEGPPPLGPGLAQDKAARMPKAVDGNWLDTRAACPPLNANEQSRLKELQTKAAFALNTGCGRVRTAWLQQRTTEIATRCGITEQAARTIAIKHADGVLLPAIELTFANPAIGVVTVGDVLPDPDKYVDESLADPWEGPSYGRQTAKVLRRQDGSIFVNSYAHGGQAFELKFDADAINKILTSTAASNVVDTMINHVLSPAASMKSRWMPWSDRPHRRPMWACVRCSKSSKTRVFSATSSRMPRSGPWRWRIGPTHDRSTTPHSVMRPGCRRWRLMTPF
jgi:hypothetical protein